VKIFQIILFVMIWAVFCMAEPADYEPFFLKQPDGTTLLARLVGDEHFSVLETADGYILQKDALGYYAYADETGKSSGIYARDPNSRSSSELQFLAKLNPDAIYQKLLAESPDDEALEYGIPKFALPKIQRMPVPNKKLTLGDIRGVVILVQFSDIKFKNADPKKQFSEMLNKEGYNEFHHQGSARDYFIKNSSGAFRPTFDVIGPITISQTRAYYGGTSDDRRYNMARKALIEALDTLLRWNSIDFSQYDNDKDGNVDFVYMIYAGVGRSSSGVVESIWPHASSITKRMGNGPTVKRYACSNEIGGRAYKANSATSTPNGIGTFVHEFGHVLGLPDLYDVSGNNKQKTPHSWSIMAHGGYNCPTNSDNVQGCAPAFYSAFERMSVGWMAAPTELNVKGQVQLDKIDDNIAYSVTNPQNPNEMFLLEYRTNKNWDAGQPRSGMLIWHIDYVASVWSNRKINVDGSHMYVDIEEAVATTGTSAASSDPFPGSRNVTSFNKFVFWNGNDMNISLTNIKESSDKEYITFDVDMTVKSSSSMSSSSSTTPFSSSSQVASSTSTLSSSSIESSSSQSSSSSNPSSSSFSSSSSQSSSSSAISSSSIATLSSSSIESSSSIAPSSSSIALISSSSETVLSSSAIESSSSEQSSSSSEAVLSSSAAESSSSAIISSSSEVESSNSTITSSSSKVESSSSEQSSSSSEIILSSSAAESSSSSDYPVFAAASASPYRTHVASQNGMIHVITPTQGTKNIRIFSPNGQLLFETRMDGMNYQFPLPRKLGKQNVILSVTQGKKTLFMGMVAGSP